MDCRICRAPGICICEPAPPSGPPAVLAGDDGTCVRCGAAPRNASGLCATCLDEDAERAGEIPPAALAGDEAHKAYTDALATDGHILSLNAACAAYHAALSAPPADVAALLADLHELDWGALPAVGRAAAAIEALMARVHEYGHKMLHLANEAGTNRGRAEAAEARVVQLEEALREIHQTYLQGDGETTATEQRMADIAEDALSTPAAKGGDNE
jgi:hypothetical protein